MFALRYKSWNMKKNIKTFTLGNYVATRKINKSATICTKGFYLG
jgi:hypothetical protein